MGNSKVKILVLNPITLHTKNVVRDVLYGCWCSGKRIGGGTVPPFALLQVATVLKNDANEVLFIDAQAEQTPIQILNSKINKFDLVVVSTSTMTIEEDANLLLSFKKIKPELVTIVFGSHPTFLPKATLSKEGIDIAVMHEPEYIIRDFASCMRKKSGWKNLKGIAYRNGSDVVINPSYPFISNLDDLPFPCVSMLPHDIDYFNPIVRRMPYITTSTSRGCPAKCRFCTAPAFDGKRLRFQSADYVIEEIEYFLKRGYKEIYFRDDTFFVNKKRDFAICERIINKNLDVTWIANARIGMIDKETMSVAKKAGCHTIKFGVESGVQEILDISNKGYRIEEAIETFKWAKEVGISTHAHCMLGMPGDNEETIKQTIRFVKHIDPTTATFGICTPYPGAPLYEDVLKVHPEIGDGSSVDLSKLHVEGLFNEVYTDISKIKLDKYVKKAYRAYYLRPRMILRFIKQMKSIDDFKRITLSGARVIDFALFGN